MSPKPSPLSAIKTGYMLEKAERKATKCLLEAQECLQQTIEDLKELGETVNQYDVTVEREEIFDIMGGIQRVRAVHKSLADKLLELGYEPITDADFEQFGAGTKR